MNRITFRGQGNAGMVPAGPLGKAKLALANGDVVEAERLTRKQLERRPEDASARLLLGQILLQMRRNTEALAEIRRVVREQPKNVEALLSLSAALTQQGGLRVPAEAEQTARRAIQLAPRNANAHVQLAEVMAAKRDYKVARAEIEEACRLDPRSPNAHLMRAIILMSDKDPAGAVQATDSAIRSGRTTLGPGGLAQAEVIKANALVEVRRYDDALVSLDAAEKQNPMLSSANNHSLRGRIYFRKRQWRQSYGEYLIAQRLNGRLLWLAPVLAGVNMVLSVFGSRAPYALVVILALIVFAILFGVSNIPAVGDWLVAALVLVMVGFFAFFSVRTLQGSILPGEAQARLTTIAAIGFAVIAGFALALFIYQAIAQGIFHASNWFDANAVTITGAIALILGALAAYFWPRLLGRFEGRRAA
ncbi:MAG TPA: tetratricopeptide repeat protein [Ktedonobacterales bacterium]|nr:tetratricopeptide repeat protein [Ktedonobacterales bacterium]